MVRRQAFRLRARSVSGRYRTPSPLTSTQLSAATQLLVPIECHSFQGVSLLQVIEGAVTEGFAYPSKTFRWTGAAILDACTVAATNGRLLVLTADGSLHVLDLQLGTSTQVCNVDLPEISPGEEDSHFGVPRYCLHASPDGSFAAVVIDRGRAGVVVETLTGRTTMQLDGGDYCEDTVPFSACFLRLYGRDVFVHRTQWNRLDAADPSTGLTLTDRYIAPYEPAGERPDHYLDYFHGRVLPSPDGKLLFDDGWVWHPISIPRIWSVDQWLGTNPWESEDGSSIMDLGMRDDWTQPACWIDELRIAVWGAVGLDDEAYEEAKQAPGVRIFEVAKGKLGTDNWWPLPDMENVTALFSDGTCLYVAAAEGTTVWDIGSRERLAHYPGFVARGIDRALKTLVAFDHHEIQQVESPW